MSASMAEMEAALKAAEDAIAAIKAAFGAPGDYGYGTPQGDALFALYKARIVISGALAKAA